MTDQFFLMGLDQGADVSAGEISSGAALGDFNGYSLTFTAMEELPANFIDVTTEAGLATRLLPMQEQLTQLLLLHKILSYTFHNKEALFGVPFLFYT